VLSASNRNIKEDVSGGTFREDLYYRLNVIHLGVPALKERLDDLPLLVQHFVEKYRADRKGEKIELAPEVWKALYNYSWPGNVRELENIIERALILRTGNSITLNELPEEIKGAEAEFDVERFIPTGIPLPAALERIEEELIRRALRQSNNVQAHAAEVLGITKSLIQHKMKKYNIVI
jgi:two-component system NtrC family response regulator